jgi:quinol monooxygenase YgiN
MTKIARSGRVQAKPGQGDRLAGLMLQVADSLRATPGCELYLINQAADDADVVWITEQWSDQEAMDGALAAAQSGDAGEDVPTPAEVMALAVPGQWQMTELKPLGGIGVPQAPGGYKRVSLGEVEDVAPKFGFGEIGEARFASDDLGLGPTGISLQRLKPGMRQSFGHRHHRAEEVYVVLSGSGRVKIADEEVELGTLDAIRVGPQLARCFEADAEGMEFIAFGQRLKGDGEVLPGWWGD